MRFLLRKNIAARFLMSACLITLFAVLIEAVSWLYVTNFRDHYQTRFEFRATRPLPYQGASYFGSEFLEESERAARGEFFDQRAVNDDVSGQYFNIRKGMRVTTGQPMGATGRVLMFGGSTIFCQEVPDSETIPSHLQRRLNDAYPGLWSVENHGVPGMTAGQQLRRLKAMKISSRDIIVFYDGVNDIYHTVFSGYRSGLLAGFPHRPTHRLSPIHKLMLKGHQQFKDISYTAEWALDIYNRGLPDTVTDSEILSDNIDLAVNVFEASLRDTVERTDQAGALFVHFLQPHLFSKTSLGAYERTLLANPLQTPSGLERAFADGWPRFQDLEKRLADDGILAFDISNTLDGLDNVYLDYSHVNHVANAVIAERIAGTLIPILASAKVTNSD